MTKKHVSVDIEKKLVVQIDFTSRINKIFRTRFHKNIVSNDIDADEFAILVALMNEPNISQLQIGKLLCKGKAHIGKMLTNMAAKGYVKRNLVEGQAPCNVVTTKGKELYHTGIKQIQQIMDKKLDEEFSTLEQEQFISFLIRYRNVITSITDVNLK